MPSAVLRTVNRRTRLVLCEIPKSKSLACNPSSAWAKNTFSRLDVAVHDAALVNDAQRVHDGQQRRDGLLRIERTLLLDARG